MALALFVGLIALVGGVVVGDAAVSIYSTWAVAHGELACAVIGQLLALWIGIGVEAAEGHEENGAQAQSQPCGDEQARGFAGNDGGGEGEEQSHAALPFVAAAEPQEDEDQQREEEVDAQFDAHPAPQRN